MAVIFTLYNTYLSMITSLYMFTVVQSEMFAFARCLILIHS